MLSFARLAVICLPAMPLAAQWHVAILAAGGSATGHARAVDMADTDPLALLPDHPRSSGVAFGRTGSRWDQRMIVRFAAADLTVRGATTALVTRDAVRGRGVAFEILYRVAGARAQPTLHAALGAGIDRWRFRQIDEAARTRGSWHAALEGRVPLSRRWHAIVRGEVAWSPSLFERDELPQGYRAAVGRRRSVVFGIARRFGGTDRPALNDMSARQ